MAEKNEEQSLNSIIDKLAEPFHPSVIKWRVGRKKKGDDKVASMLAYVDARIIMDRLDAVVGPANWQSSIVETPKGRIITKLSVRLPGTDEWISKSDGAGETQVEGEKGAISDSLKRAAVHFGIARYLYALPAPYVAIDNWGKPTPESQRRLDQVYSKVASQWKELRGKEIENRAQMEIDPADLPTHKTPPTEPDTRSQAPADKKQEEKPADQKQEVAPTFEADQIDQLCDDFEKQAEASATVSELKTLQGQYSEQFKAIGIKNPRIKQAIRVWKAFLDEKTKAA